MVTGCDTAVQLLASVTVSVYVELTVGVTVSMFEYDTTES